ncbi:MAG: Tll0287-like domain-containing protein [Gammaproteobacteria bacterium]
MRKLIFILTCSLCLSSLASADNHLKERASKSKEVAQDFMKQLKAELGKAMKSGGPVAAISVCNHQAPLIAKNLSDKYGWKIARTSLQVRNPENSADDWEADVLQKFENRKAMGEAVKPMAYYAVVENNNQQNFRFMKAIPTAEVCLKCHGQNIAPEVKARLDELYPTDKARGYKLGDIRGAFTISQPM